MAKATPATAENSALVAFVQKWPDATRHALTEDGDWERNIRPALAELAQIIAFERDATTRLMAARIFMECLYCHARSLTPPVAGEAGWAKVDSAQIQAAIDAATQALDS